MNSNLGISYQVPYDVLYPLAPIAGIGSQNEITPAVLNNRLSLVRNNQHAILRAMGGLAESIGGTSFITEYARGLSDVLFSDTISYGAAELQKKTLTTTTDLAGSTITFDTPFVRYQCNGIGSITASNVEVLAFIDGRLCTSPYLNARFIYGSALFFIDASLITVGSKVTFIVLRKFNRWGNTITKRNTYTADKTYADSTNNPLVLTYDKSIFGNFYSTEHIAVIVNGTERLANDKTQYLIEENENAVIITFIRTINEKDVVKLYNTTEFASGLILNTAMTIYGNTVTIPKLTLADGSDYIPRDSFDFYLFLNTTRGSQLHVSPEAITVNSNGSVSVDWTKINTSLKPTDGFRFYWVHTAERVKSLSLSGLPAESCLGNDNVLTRPEYSVNKPLYKTGMLVFNNGYLYSDCNSDGNIEFDSNGNQAIFKEPYSEPSKFVIFQSQTVPGGIDSTLSKLYAAVVADLENASHIVLSNDLNGGGKRLKNIGDAVDAQDATTLSQVQQLIQTASEELTGLAVALSGSDSGGDLEGAIHGVLEETRSAIAKSQDEMLAMTIALS